MSVWDQYLVTGGRWRCDGCSVLNEREVLVCPCCGTEKPGQKNNSSNSKIEKEEPQNQPIKRRHEEDRPEYSELKPAKRANVDTMETSQDSVIKSLSLDIDDNMAHTPSFDFPVNNNRNNTFPTTSGSNFFFNTPGNPQVDIIGQQVHFQKQIEQIQQLEKQNHPAQPTLKMEMSQREDSLSLLDFQFHDNLKVQNTSKNLLMGNDSQVKSIYYPNNGKVYGFGSNNNDILGLGDLDEARIPTLIDIPEPIKQLSCGGMHCLGLTNDGSVYSWGCNDDGVLGREGDGKKPLAINKSSFNNEKIIKVTCGSTHSVSLSENGNIYYWGVYRGGNGKIGFDSADRKYQSTPKLLTKPPNVDRFIDIVSGADFTMAITDQNILYIWGSNEIRQLGKEYDENNKESDLLPSKFILHENNNIQISRVFAGTYHAFCIDKNSNKVYGWGCNSFGQLGIGDKSVNSTGNNDKNNNNKTNENQDENGNEQEPEIPVFNPIEIPQLSDKNIVDIRCGDHHTIVLTGTGKVYVMGDNRSGQLGLYDSYNNCEKLPRELLKFSNIPVIAIGCGTYHSLCVTNDGRVYTWGSNVTYQLGNNSNDDCPDDEILPIEISFHGKGRGMQVDGGPQQSYLLVDE